eukprot:IDg4316t1
MSTRASSEAWIHVSLREAAGNLGCNLIGLNCSSYGARSSCFRGKIARGARSAPNGAALPSVHSLRIVWFTDQ